MCILSGCTWCFLGSTSSAKMEGWFLKRNLFIAVWHQKRADIYSPIQQEAENVLIPCSAYESLQKWKTGLALLAFKIQSWAVNVWWELRLILSLFFFCREVTRKAVMRLYLKGAFLSGAAGSSLSSNLAFCQMWNTREGSSMCFALCLEVH